MRINILYLYIIKKTSEMLILSLNLKNSVANFVLIDRKSVAVGRRRSFGGLNG